MILCPAFVSDCLETLEEIDVRGKEEFMDAGGESFTMIPCLNTNQLWVDVLANWVKEYAAGSQAMTLWCLTSDLVFLTENQEYRQVEKMKHTTSKSQV